MQFENKTVLVTGGSSGIGKAIAQRFLANGARVYVLDVVKPDFEVDFMQADVTNDAEVQAAVATLPALDILVNNAGIYMQSSIEEMPVMVMSKMIDINIKGTVIVTKYALPLLKRSKGNIINVSSCLGQITEPGSSVYCASKAAVIMLAKVWSQEYAPEGVRVNAVLPGPIDTPMLRKFLPTDEDIKRHGLNKPLGRIGKPEEVASLVAFLASEEANYITGGEFAVDGGESAGSVYTK